MQHYSVTDFPDKPLQGFDSLTLDADALDYTNQIGSVQKTGEE
jgi:hypothetical protein